MIEWLGIEDWIASVLFIIEDFTLDELETLNLESAGRSLAAAAATAGGQDLYQDIHDKAALLLVQMLRDPPGPPHYARLVATYSAFVFLKINGHACDPPEHELVHWVAEAANERLSTRAVGSFLREHCTSEQAGTACG